MKIQHDLISVLLFWSLYVPISLVLWFETGHKDNWAIILVIGVAIVLFYLIINLIITKMKKKKEINEGEEREQKEITIEKQNFPLPLLDYDNVFKENFGVVKRDVD